MRKKKFLDYNYNNFLGVDQIHGVEFPVFPIINDIDRKDFKEKEYDFLFYGAIDIERRKKFIEKIRLYGFTVEIAQGLYGRSLLEKVSKAKVVLNIHAYESMVFESLRCLQPASVGTFILSEYSKLPRVVDWTKFVCFHDFEALNENSLLSVLYQAESKWNNFKIKPECNVRALEQLVS